MLKHFSEDHGSSIRLDAVLNYRGDCHVDVTCTVGSLDPRRSGIGILVVKLHLLGCGHLMKLGLGFWRNLDCTKWS